MKLAQKSCWGRWDSGPSWCMACIANWFVLWAVEYGWESLFLKHLKVVWIVEEVGQKPNVLVIQVMMNTWGSRMYWGRELLAGSVGRTRGSVSGSGVKARCWAWSLLLNVFGVRVMGVAWAPFLPLKFLCWPPLLHFAAGSYYQLTDGLDKTP